MKRKCVVALPLVCCFFFLFLLETTLVGQRRSKGAWKVKSEEKEPEHGF